MGISRSIRRLVCRLLWMALLLSCIYITTYVIVTYMDLYYTHLTSLQKNIRKNYPIKPRNPKVLVFLEYGEDAILPEELALIEAKKGETVHSFKSKSDYKDRWSPVRNREKEDVAQIISDNSKEDTKIKDEEMVKTARMAPVHPDNPQINPGAPGEMGKPVIIDRTKLSPQERDKFEAGFRKHAFNQYVSDMISLHRSLPDVRDPECKQIEYMKDLPDASVIIIFHNEAWSVLLRTVHSVLDRSPPHLLKEIVLVDDFSDLDHLKQPLGEYFARVWKVSIVRLKERSGLIRARITGFDASSGEVAIFLDSHCEVTEGWLEPLLDRIGRNYTNVVVPVIDIINGENFQIHYNAAKYSQAGGFGWNLIFNWHNVPEHERRRRNYLDYIPFRTPTMAGGLFAISRKFFLYLGKYDPGLDIWGGENLELSFKTWMCGGTLETIPCSHVGHIFRKRIPYGWAGGVNVVQRNTNRLAEVWLDEFKEFYYERIGHTLGEYGDISDRIALRKSLNCKNFRWYINNIYPELFLPSESKASGDIQNKARPICADGNVDADESNKHLRPYACHYLGGNQYWLLSTENEIRRDTECWDYVKGSIEIKFHNCHGQHGNQEWIYRKDETIYHPQSQRCLELGWDGRNITMDECTGQERQKWLWQRGPAKGPKRYDSD
ncbi:hypothetical protein ACJMK2_024207 [Sinanodonta woodiana]|uniref:Polypeptide N-acetylgalactosaminyltransferase n=1 Tax=Sinanodonta woodiana TaxID=1069815 RepID=A0ABD3T6P6_SINWO